jgi:glucose-1-phosphatase
VVPGSSPGGPTNKSKANNALLFLFLIMADIKNIVFDLGGVLLNIDTTKTDAAFEKLGLKDFKNNYSMHKADKLFDNLETGHVDDTAFYDGIRGINNNKLTDDEIKNAWNALLLDFRNESLQWIENNRGHFNFYLLSNTNSIHHTSFHKTFTEQTGKNNFDDYFTKAFYSFAVGLRKPEKEIYQHLLSDTGITAGETLFIDDLLKNIEAAAALGINTHHLLPHERIENLGL